MRIISGFLKGREIKGYNILGTRPTMDRVKESLFASIQNYIKDSVVLDLFAGSGNLGIEAISNGSKYCYFVDNNKKVIDVLTDNINSLKINDKCSVAYSDCFKYLNTTKVKFDLIFLDPPYMMDIVNDILNIVIERQLISENGLIICEVNNNNLANDYLVKVKEKKYSDKYIIIFKSNLNF